MDHGWAAMNRLHGATRALSAFAMAFLTTLPAYGDMRLDRVIVDFKDAATRRTDIEVANRGKETIYVSVAPTEIIHPGAKEQERRTYRDPMEMGMLVSPTRMILEPGQSKPVRLAILERPKDSDRIYRVRISPTVGRTIAIRTGLRVLVGYDVLVMVRPENAKPEISGERNGKKLTLRNTGNSNVLLVDGKQCDTSRKCADLPTTRLYAGTTWSVDLPSEGQVEYRLQSGGPVYTQKF